MRLETEAREKYKKKPTKGYRRVSARKHISIARHIFDMTDAVSILFPFLAIHSPKMTIPRLDGLSLANMQQGRERKEE